jgi:hypothetical protein
MAHTLFNPNNVRTDGRPGWDSAPQERQPLINAFEMGGKDARSGFSKGAKGYKNKQERQAYELGLKYASGLMAGSPVDVSSEAANLLTAKPPVIIGKPRGRRKVELTEAEAAAKKQIKAAQTKEWKATKGELLAARDVLDLPAPVRDEFASQDAYLDYSMQFRANRNKALDLLNGLATGPRRDTALGKTAQEGLTNQSITPQELSAVKEKRRYVKAQPVLNFLKLPTATRILCTQGLKQRLMLYLG